MNGSAPAVPARIFAVRARSSSTRRKNRRWSRDRPPPTPRVLESAQAAAGDAGVRHAQHADPIVSRIAAISRACSKLLATGNSMFDWPEQRIHIAHQDIGDGLAGARLRAYLECRKARRRASPGSAAANGRLRPHALQSCYAQVLTVTISPAAIRPRLGMGRSRCRTAWSGKISCSKGRPGASEQGPSANRPSARWPAPGRRGSAAVH